MISLFFFFFSSRRRHTRFKCDWSSDVCSSDLFLKRQSEKYDIIMLSLPVTKTSRSLEGYSLTENFLFTTDSINDYMEHLTEEGRLIVVAHDPVEIMKLLSVSLTSLDQRGVAS